MQRKITSPKVRIPTIVWNNKEISPTVQVRILILDGAEIFLPLAHSVDPRCVRNPRDKRESKGKRDARSSYNL